MWKTIRIPLPGGTLKIKQRDQLRKREQQRVVPVWRVGKFYIIWWPSSLK